jgi:hypothetical protein
MRYFLIKTTFVFMVLFSAKASAQTIQLIRSMSFGDQVVGVGATVVVAPTDAGAAVFNASAMTPGRNVTCSFSNSSVTLSNGGIGTNNRITVNNFTISGCTAIVPPSGTISNIGAGATATITTSKNQGAYTGSNTFRLVTN